jgi:signal transduction histidine kinase
MGGGRRRNEVWGRVAHVFLSVAVAVPVIAGLGVVGLSMAQPKQSALDLGMLALIGVGFVGVIVWVALLPQVRPVEVAVARALLGVDLPGVAPSTAWPARWRGLGWLAFLMTIGVVVAFGFLYLLPTGVALVAHPFTGRSEMPLPGATDWRPGAGMAAFWLVPVGLVPLAAGVWVIAVCGRLSVRLAPKLLGPSLTERVAVAAERERRLAHANALARDVHDGLGHILTAMTVQITAARRLLPRDRDAADRALSAAEELGRQAQADIDEVVGALRDSGTEARPTDAELRDESGALPVELLAELEPLLAGTSLDIRVSSPPTLLVSPPVAAAGFRVVREGMTNALKYGDGSASLELSAPVGRLIVELENPVGTGGVPGRRSGSGLVGLREQVMLAGGTLDAGRNREDGPWVLRAELPMQEARPTAT